MEEVMIVLRKLLVTCLLLVPLVSLAASSVNINTADSDALVEGLTGIGPQKAMAIVRYRQQHGPFKHVNDLAQVDGIGEKTVDQNRANMTVSAPQKSR
jgi:competence protein ComEA